MTYKEDYVVVLDIYTQHVEVLHISLCGFVFLGIFKL